MISRSRFHGLSPPASTEWTIEMRGVVKRSFGSAMVGAQRGAYLEVIEVALEHGGAVLLCLACEGTYSARLPSYLKPDALFLAVRVAHATPAATAAVASPALCKPKNCMRSFCYGRGVTDCLPRRVPTASSRAARVCRASQLLRRKARPCRPSKAISFYPFTRLRGAFRPAPSKPASRRRLRSGSVLPRMSSLVIPRPSLKTAAHAESSISSDLKIPMG